jgi:hypothetical protein
VPGLMLPRVANHPIEAPSTKAAPQDFIRNTMEVLKPVNLAFMNNAHQRATLLAEDERVARVAITVRPLQDAAHVIGENPQWRGDYAHMADVLRPGLTANWDEGMRLRLLGELAQSGIYPDRLTDRQLVQSVSTWLLRRQTGGPAPFIAYFVDFKDGKPFVPAETRRAFDAEKVHLGLRSDDEAFQKGLFGRGMFEAKTRGSCTPSAILQATVLRALGIPTRLILTIPPMDANVASQRQLASAIQDPNIRDTVLQGTQALGGGGWASHTFNEVFVGNRWERLNYSRLGQPVLDPQFMGMLLQVNGFNDWAESGLVRTWGAYASSASEAGWRPPAPFESRNPYRSLTIEDGQSTRPTQTSAPTQPQGWQEALGSLAQLAEQNRRDAFAPGPHR